MDKEKTQKRRIFKAFVAGEFANNGWMYGFKTRQEREDFVKTYVGATSKGFIDVAPRQYQEWVENGWWTDWINKDDTEYIRGGSLLRHGSDDIYEGYPDLERR